MKTLTLSDGYILNVTDGATIAEISFIANMDEALEVYKHFTDTSLETVTLGERVFYNREVTGIKVSTNGVARIYTASTVEGELREQVDALVGQKQELLNENASLSSANENLTDKAQALDIMLGE